MTAPCQSVGMADQDYELSHTEHRHIRWLVGVGTVGVLVLAASIVLFNDDSRPPMGAYVVVTAALCLITVALVLRVHTKARKRSVSDQ